MSNISPLLLKYLMESSVFPLCVCALVCLIDKKVKRQLFEKCSTIVTDTLRIHRVYLCAQIYFILFELEPETIFSLRLTCCRPSPFIDILNTFKSLQMEFHLEQQSVIFGRGYAIVVYVYCSLSLNEVFFQQCRRDVGLLTG